MPSSKFLTLTWSEIEEATLGLAEKIASSGEFYHAVIGILRGGWVPARMLADLLDIKEVGGLEIKFYRGIEERGERPVVTQPPVIELKDKNVLVVDDVADTGKSLQTAVNTINLFGAKLVRTAVLYVKPWCMSEPDYYYGKTDRWIVFPWEYREVIEELLTAEYKVPLRLKEDIDRACDDLSGKLGLDKEYIRRILNIILKQKY